MTTRFVEGVSIKGASLPPLSGSRFNREAQQIAFKILANFPDLSDEILLSCIERSAGTTYEFAKSAIFHHQKETLRREGGAIAVFGSARPEPTDTNPIRREGYQKAQELGKTIVNTALPIDRNGARAQEGAAVASGAGPGFMQASCQLAGGKVWGHGILVPHENGLNPHVPEHRSSMYQRFPFRKLALMDDMTRGVVVLPGGYGTIEEFTEVLNLTESRTIPDKPVVFIGKQFWQPILDAMRNSELISQRTFSSILVVDQPDQAVQEVLNWYHRNPEHRDYRPFGMLESYAEKSATLLNAKEVDSLESMNSGTLRDKVDRLAAAIENEFTLLLSGRKTGADGNLITEKDILAGW